jgi:hypothetical protein
MGATFKSWLIANFEITFGGLIIIITGIYTCLAVENSQLQDVFIVYLGLSVVFVAFIVPTQNGAIGIGKYILLILFGILVQCFSKEPEHAIVLKMLPYYWGLLAISSVIGAFIARYAYTHFDEVVSRRMLWRNSNVDLFDIRWRYALDRFSGIVCTLMFGIVWSALIAYIGINNTW